MDYKEIHQELFEEFEQEMGREPNFIEMNDLFRDRISSLVDHYKDQSKYE
jgi:hypothetical protein